MADYIKVGDRLKEISNNPKEEEFSLKDLRRQKQNIKSDIDIMQLELERVNMLIDKCIQLQVPEGSEI